MLPPDADYVDLRRGGGRALSADPESLPTAMVRRRAFTLLGLTLVAPGSAQLVAGNRTVGRVALRFWVLTLLGLALTALLFFLDRGFVLGLLANQFVLLLLAGALAIGAVCWAGLFVDALRLCRPRLLPRGTRRGLAALTAALIAVTSGPLAFGASNVMAGRDAVAGVFGGHQSVPPSDGRYNILLMGGDSGASRTGTRPDTIMLASMDADTGKTVLFGFARDTENITFRPGSTMAKLMPQGWNCGDECLLNGIYQWAMEHKDQFPADVKDPGALATKEAVEALSGLDIQYYGLVNLKGFQRFIDAVGGIDVDVKKRTPIGGGTSPITGWIEPGQQHLDGYHALWYARSREGSSNYERMARQRCVMTAMVHQLTPQTVILNFQKIAGVSGSVLTTDIPDQDLGELADLAIKARGYKMTSVNFVPPLIKPWDYDPSVIHTKVKQTIAASEADTSTPTSAAPKPKSTAKRTPSATGSAGSAGSSTDATNDLNAVCSAS